MALFTGRSRRLRLAALAVTAAVALAGCGGGNIKNDKTASSSGGKSCGTFNIAVNPWTGYVSNAHLVGYVAAHKLGCTVIYQDV
jgi:glycine betaine/proline transport system substrate-binding protein